LAIPVRKLSSQFVFLADIGGTFLFAVEGAMIAIHAQLDPVGILVLAFANSLVGGLARDLLIGAVPPRAIQDWRLPAIAFAATAVTFFFSPWIGRIPTPLLVGLDAAALGLFAMAGTSKALNYGINPLSSMLLGTLTGVGGGTVRDVLLARVPTVLHSEIYATAAFVGAFVLVIGLRLRQSPALMAFLGGTVCFVIRVVSLLRHWQLPKAPFGS
jgi:uncharacterized membrane protein YeiH